MAKRDWQDVSLDELREQMIESGLDPKNLQHVRDFINKQFPEVFADPEADYERAMKGI